VNSEYIQLNNVVHVKKEHLREQTKYNYKVCVPHEMGEWEIERMREKENEREKERERDEWENECKKRFPNVIIMIICKLLSLKWETNLHLHISLAC